MLLSWAQNSWGVCDRSQRREKSRWASSWGWVAGGVKVGQIQFSRRSWRHKQEGRKSTGVPVCLGRGWTMSSK